VDVGVALSLAGIEESGWLSASLSQKASPRFELGVDVAPWRVSRQISLVMVSVSTGLLPDWLGVMPGDLDAIP
jgi:hypothetical protein